MAITKITNDLLATPPDDTGLQDDIALIGFKVAANGSLAKYNLVDQTIDDFQNTSGVSAGGSTNEARNASNYYYGETTVTPTVSGNYDSTGTDGAYSWYKWTTVTSSGTYTTDTAQEHEYLVVAGGGGGGPGPYAGGGGAGGFRTATGFAVAATTISGITVGAGGAGGVYSTPTDATNGGNSVFDTITSDGGGAGGYIRGTNVLGHDGGSGGGGCYNGSAPWSGGSGVSGQGYDGGVGGTWSGQTGGGGGGASEVGAAGTGSPTGGDGVASSITGSSVTYAGGGGGSSQSSASNPAGGTGGGGAGGSGEVGNTPPVAGTNGLGGGGGGGGGASTSGGVGGSGIVIIKRPTSVQTEGGNLTLVSTTTTAQAAPTKGDIVFTYTNGAGSTTLGGGSPDVTAEYSADGGSTWTSMTLASEGTTGGHNIATAHDVTLTSTSGTSMAYRIKTLNQSATKTTRIQAVSLGWS
jgi:hypothetical protein